MPLLYYLSLSFLSDPCYMSCLWLRAILSSQFGLLIKVEARDDAMTLTFVLPVFVFASVVQRVDSVSEGMENYGGKIIAVETDLKKLGEPDACAHLYASVFKLN